MEKNLIELNPGKRFVFKLLLNSMWGRLGMNTDRQIHKLIVKPDVWFKMISDDQYIIHSANFTENSVLVFYSMLHVEGSNETSVVHAAMVIAYGRLKLYDEMEKLGDQVLYFDTDSIIYVERPNCYTPKLGLYLGDLTDELDHDDYIVEFVSETYSYQKTTRIIHLKVN